MIATEIIARTAENYQNCQSYQDDGVVETYPDFGYSRKSFRTYFARPNRFRFEWTSFHPKFGEDGPQSHDIIWTNGQNVYGAFSAGKGQQEEMESLRSAAAAASGISSGAVGFIPALIIVEIGDLFYRTILSLDNPKLLPDQTIGTLSCYHLQATQDACEDTELWIDKNFSIKRVKIRTDKLGGRDRIWFTEINYRQNAFNAAIPDETFNYIL